MQIGRAIDGGYRKEVERVTCGSGCLQHLHAKMAVKWPILLELGHGGLKGRRHRKLEKKPNAKWRAAKD
jgi:hypothetical protein